MPCLKPTVNLGFISCEVWEEEELKEVKPLDGLQRLINVGNGVELGVQDKTNDAFSINDIGDASRNEAHG